MTPTATPTRHEPSPPADPQGAGSPPPSEWVVAAACVALVLAASLAFGRVFIDWSFLRWVGAAVVLSVGGQMLARRAGAGGIAGLAVGVVAWAMFVSLAFPSLAATLLGGVVPTLDTLRAGVILFAEGIALMQVQPPPATVEPQLLVLVVTGVWWIAHAVDVLAVRLRSPLHAIVAALVLWTVPLALADRPGEDAWLWALPVLAAAVALLLVSSHKAASGWAAGAAAIVAGALLAGYVPGFDEDPMIRPGSGGSGLTRTDNPIVDIRSNLTDPSDDPVARVQTSDPVYLRWTSLDRYSANEQWTNDGLNPGSLADPLPPEAAPSPYRRRVEVEIESLQLTDEVLVPAPYHARAVDGSRADDMRWDPEMATLTMASGESLDIGDRYRVSAEVPQPPADELREVDVSGGPPELTHLPSVPDEVAELAERIVAEAGAETAYDQAMAIQRELQSWEYSLDPPPGHSGSHMVDFIRRRVGYCEQYAGTMAVMLRSLDIPARVAVGFTPGRPVGEDTFVVRHDNAHAWVEVRFPGHGWIYFEPTPRDDGNLLTPRPGNLAPTELDSERLAREFEDDPGTEFEGPDVPPEQDIGGPEPDPELGDAADGSDAGGGDGSSGGSTPWRWVAAAVVGLAGAGTLLAHRRSRHVPTVPAEAVLARVARVERLGAGLGRPRAPHETDAEYLRAITDDPAVVEPLIAAADRARWALTVPRAGADAARDAEQVLRRRRLADLGPLARAAVAIRGWWHTTWRQLRARLPALRR